MKRETSKSKLKEIEPSTDKDMVPKNVNLKNLKKIKAMHGPYEVYMHSFLFFEELDYLRDQKIPWEGRSAKDSEITL
jgi:hypothetical protein